MFVNSQKDDYGVQKLISEFLAPDLSIILPPVSFLYTADDNLGK